MRRIISKQNWNNLAAFTLVVLGLLAMADVAWAARLASTNRSTAGNTLAPAPPACVIRDNANKPTLGNNDPLARLLLAGGPCPANVFEFRARLLSAGAKMRTAFVSNRGFHNPADGSFSMFEIVSGRLAPAGLEVADGEFFFGHFTARAAGNKLIANQDPQDGNLMVELIAFDPQKKLFNFYEVIGNGQRGLWFYRGDSLDIQADVKLLHRQVNPSRPQFGSRLRCSGCHVAGGPIMKELAQPHNDWDTARHLSLDNMKPDAELARILSGIVDADEFAKSVNAGLLKLNSSEKFQQARSALSLQEQLRPLFCPVELNLESDLTPLDDKGSLRIPSAFLVDSRLARGSVTIERAQYDVASAALNAIFPEGPQRRDGDHGWLTPVKAFSDTLATDSLIKQGLIDQEFLSDVLATDMTNPVFSKSRCGLLRFVPIKADANWKETLKASLKANAKTNPAAQELLNNFTDPTRNAQFHQARGARLLTQCQERLQTKDSVTSLYRLLAQRRAEAFTSEISKNPLGEILEPGFRVIFPDTRPKIRPGSFRLTDDCQVASQ